MVIDNPSHEPRTRLEQLRILTSAYKSLTLQKPLLPSSDSPLPALLALRSALNQIDQSKVSIRKTSRDIGEARAKIRQERDDLEDACEVTQALETRIKALTLENERQAQGTPEELAHEMIQKEMQKRRQYNAESKKLVNAFNSFVEEHLAAMIAAEELGGPVVGNMVDVDEHTLRTGVSQRSGPKRAKEAKAREESTESEREQRIEDIWGSGDNGSYIESKNERKAAGTDFRSLTEDLLNASAGAEGTNPYIHISRESAAVRFLVREKVAKFHPDDARQLRLVEFDKELED